MIQLRDSQTPCVFTVSETQNIFFTSDTHFWHANILRYCNRPYSSIEEMNEALITNWNSVVKPNDIVFHLGDFAFCGADKFNEILDRLNGKIYWVLGNHDWSMLKQNYADKFEAIEQQMAIRINHKGLTYKIYLNHFPYLAFSGAWNFAKPTWQLFGHVHSTKNNSNGLDQKRMTELFPSQYDVGVDNNNYTPIAFEDVKQIIEDQILSLNMVRNNEVG